MFRNATKISMFLVMIFGATSLVQAQRTLLSWPENLQVIDDVLHWDAVENARGYRVQSFGLSSND